MLKRQSHYWLAALINLVLFVVFFIVFYPIYDSKEDAYAAYLLSGGFGNTPTELLHYNYGFHPLMTIIVRNLFLLTDRVNWYTIALIAGHYLSSTVILSLLLRKNKSWVTLLTYLVLFLIFEGFFLVIIDFSGTSVILACTSMIYLLATSQRTKLSIRHCIVAGLLLLAASLYRIHVILPLIGMALPFFLLLNTRKEKVKIFTTLLCAGLCILLFNFFQRSYYTAKDPEWPQEEANRQKIFGLYNFHAASMCQIKPGEKWYTEAQLISRGLLIDSSFLEGVWLDSMYHDLPHGAVSKMKIPPGWLKWFLINNRIFFCITVLMLFAFAVPRRIGLIQAVVLVLIAAGVYYLATNAKLPPYVLSSALYFLCLTCLLLGEIQPMIMKSRIGKPGLLALLLFFLVWGVIRMYKTSQQNKWQNFDFKAVYKEVSANKDKLFIVTKNFPIHKFYAFDLPADYKLENYADTEHFIINLYAPVFKRFGIQNNKNIPYIPAILFWGEPVDALRLYFEKLTGQPMKIITLPEYKEETVWRVVPAS